MSDSIDWGKVGLGAIAVGIAGFVGYELWWKPAHAAQAPPGPGGSPGPGGPGPGNVSTGAVSRGDTILVRTAGAFGAVPGVAGEIEAVVTAAIDGNPMLMAETTGRDGDGVARGESFPVPRSEVTRVVTRGGGGGGTPFPGLPGGFPNPFPGGLPGGLPGNIPNPLPGLLGVPQDLGSPLPMRQGHHYRARLQLEGLEAAMASADLVRGQFQALGFTDVKVYHAGVDPLPTDWPPATVIVPTNGTWYVEGTWPLQDASLPRPPQAALVWEQ